LTSIDRSPASGQLSIPGSPQPRETAKHDEALEPTSFAAVILFSEVAARVIGAGPQKAVSPPEW
jgi:hypothetical protein